jgi:hypothetical protein
LPDNGSAKASLIATDERCSHGAHSAFQAESRGFETRLPLHFLWLHWGLRDLDVSLAIGNLVELVRVEAAAYGG